MFCQNCSREEVDNPTFCLGCGARLVAPAIGVVKRSCPTCLKEIEGDGAVCPYCSQPSKPGSAQHDKNATATAGPMSKVFGWIGFGIGMVLMIVFILCSTWNLKDTTHGWGAAYFGWASRSSMLSLAAC